MSAVAQVASVEKPDGKVKTIVPPEGMDFAGVISMR